jgi:ribose transport system substrate-binding protein
VTPTTALRTLLVTGSVLAFAASPAYADAVADGVAAASAKLAQYRQKPVFKAPGEAFDIKSCAAGKKQLSIPNSSGNPFLKGIIDREIKAGATIGLKVEEWQNQGQPSQWVQGVEYAIRNHFAVIDLISGIDPKTIAPQVAAAKKAGVRTMTSHFYDPTQPRSDLTSSDLPVSFNTIGKILAAWSIVNTNGAAKVVVVKTDEVPPTGPLVDGIRSELAADCPNCKIVQEINVGIVEWATKIQSSVQSAVLAHPEVNVVLPIYDSMSQFVVPALRLAGKTGRVKVATFNGTPFVLDYVREGSVDMDIGESLDWIAYATIDGHMRDLCGLKQPAEINVPFYIFDKSNVADVGIPASYDKGYGDDYIMGFRKLWLLDK